MITVQEKLVIFNSSGQPNTTYQGVVRQTDNDVTRVIFDLTAIQGDFYAMGVNVKRGDGTTNQDIGEIYCQPIPNAPKKWKLDLSRWFTNYNGTLEIYGIVFANVNNTEQRMNLQKITFTVQEAPLVPNDEIDPEVFAVYSVNGQIGVVDLFASNILYDGTEDSVKDKLDGLASDISDIVTPTTGTIDTKITAHNTRGDAHLNIIGDLGDVTIKHYVDYKTAENIMYSVLADDTIKDKLDGLESNKANISDVNSALASKTEKTYVDTEISKYYGFAIGYTNTHNVSEEAHNDIRDELANAKAIAEGRSKAKVFATKEALDTWLLITTNIESLNVGDNLYITDVDTPDYWWDGNTYQKLEVEKVDLSDYYTKDVTYTKTETDTKLGLKADKSDTYTKTEIDTMIGDIESLLGGI